MLSICAMSDLHGILPEIEECDIVIICGDISPLMIQRNGIECKEWLFTTFANWVNNLPCDEVILIAGNHDFIFSSCEHWIHKLEECTKLKYLENSSYDYLSNDGRIYKIYGTPACHIFGNWAFMYSDEKLQELYQNIPEDCDILISHDAPKLNNCGLVPPNMWHSTPIDAGNEILASAILDKKPKYVFCGHIHEGNHHLTDVGTTKIANVSILNDAYVFSYEPLYLDI